MIMKKISMLLKEYYETYKEGRGGGLNEKKNCTRS